MKIKTVEWTVVKYYEWQCMKCGSVNKTSVPDVGEVFNSTVKCHLCGHKSKLEN